MTSLRRTLDRLEANRDRVALQEVLRGKGTPVSAGAILDRIAAARAFLRDLGLAKGDRCVLLAQNSANWIALTLALRAEGLVNVPLYVQRPMDELTAIISQCEPALVCGDDSELLARLASQIGSDVSFATLTEVTSARGSTLRQAQGRPEQSRGATSSPRAVLNSARPELVEGRADDLVAIIYTSGTSGEPKGAVLTNGSVEHVIACAGARLDGLGIRESPEQVFHYLPFCFAGSWILMLTCVSRDALVSLSLDPKASLIDDLAAVAPHYLLNVPIVLERIRARVEEQIASRPRVVQWALRQAVLRPLLHRQIRQRFGARLRGLICGSAPLARETQEWFQTIGIPVYQVYGLTETTAVCTIDREDPSQVVAGRVGFAIDGVELRRDETGEILARGPNIFAGYWRNPQATARVLSNGWLRTGDHGDVDAQGNWHIAGRVDSLIVRPNGHKVAPERLEEMLASRLPSAQHVVVVDDGGRGLMAVVAGTVSDAEAAEAIAWVNARVAPHEAIRAARIHGQPFTIENAMLTANGKIKRDRVAVWCRRETSRADSVPTEFSATA
jgi:long-chain acyl-CoA synthetase